MWYLFLQIWLWLLLAFVLGWVSHWFFCCRGKQGRDYDAMSAGTAHAVVDSQSASPADHEVEHQGSVSEMDIDQSWRPKGFDAQPSVVDDLKRIKGVGKVIEDTLHALGIYQFQQIADWTPQNIDWVEDHIAFPGRIEREDWLGQARQLSAGEETEFSSRVDSGDVDYHE